MRDKNQRLASMLGGVAIGALASAAIIGGAVRAATYQPPTGQPPEGNIPSTIWNAMDPNAPDSQANASIQIDGGGPAEDGTGAPTTNPIGLSVGNIDLDLGINNPGQNVIYAVADQNTMLADPARGYDYLMLLQTYNPSVGQYLNRMTVDSTGSVNISGDIVAEGQVKSTGCFGPVFVGLSANKYKGNLAGTTGYAAANAICKADFGEDTHVCSAPEMLNSIKCSDLGGAEIMNPAFDGAGAWINAGPPGFTAFANDCQGWTTGIGYDSGSGQTYYGRTWQFDSTTGGTGFVVTCNGETNFACCK